MHQDIILSSIAILISCTSLLISNRKATKRSVKELRNKYIDVQQRMARSQQGESNLTERAAQEKQTDHQTWAVSNEIKMLKTLLDSVQRKLELDGQSLSRHENSINKLQRDLASLLALEPSSGAIGSTESNVFGNLGGSNLGGSSERNLFPPLDEVAGWRPPTEADGLVNDLFQEPPTEPTEPYEAACQKYQSAIDQGDRQALRQLQFKELNITNACEDLLVRGNTEQATRLEAVLAGGSYVVISGDQRYWLFPTSQTLDSFGMNQPQKGIFSYERGLISKPMVKQPAEVSEEGECWVVVSKGIVVIPG